MSLYEMDGLAELKLGIKWVFMLFLQIKDLRQPSIDKVYYHCFSNSISSFCLSVSHAGNSQNISIFHYYYIFYDDL